ncbi:MAG: hypothetical protein JW795_21145 [Chitinivibrionales bacterium]|nr:hypothetical protein [Chitinivibrionales bacterium]
MTQDQNYVEELLRYIHLNPLRAGICKSLDQLDAYRWCGHGVLMGVQQWSVQQTAEVLGRFGSTVESGRQAYRRFLEKGLALDDSHSSLIRRVRESNRGMEDQHDSHRWVIGDPVFIQQVISTDTQRRLRLARHQTEGVALEQVAEQVATRLQVSVDGIRKRSRSGAASCVRKIFCYLCCNEYGFAVKEIGRFLGISGPPVSICIVQGEKLAKDNGFLLN